MFFEIADKVGRIIGKYENKEIRENITDVNGIYLIWSVAGNEGVKHETDPW